MFERGRPSSESDETESLDSRDDSEVDEAEVDILGRWGVTLGEVLASVHGVDPRINFKKRAAVVTFHTKASAADHPGTRLQLFLEAVTVGDDVRVSRAF